MLLGNQARSLASVLTVFPHHPCTTLVECPPKPRFKYLRCYTTKPINPCVNSFSIVFSIFLSFDFPLVQISKPLHRARSPTCLASAATNAQTNASMWFLHSISRTICNTATPLGVTVDGVSNFLQHSRSSGRHAFTLCKFRKIVPRRW